jgi:molybdopterin-guanine dinucleotide biosynthesis protein B
MGISGWSGSGKTTLVTRLLPELVARGLTVSTVKHAHHEFDVDTPGKDSYEHRAAGASEVLVASAKRWALMHEHRDEAGPEPRLDELLARLGEADLVLVEGFKHEGHDKIEVCREGSRREPLYPNDRSVVAVASDRPLPDAGRPVLDLDDASAVADFICRHCGLAERAA